MGLAGRAASIRGPLSDLRSFTVAMSIAPRGRCSGLAMAGNIERPPSGVVRAALLVVYCRTTPQIRADRTGNLRRAKVQLYSHA